MVYFTPSFRAYVSNPENKKSILNLWSAPICHITRQIAYVNYVLQKNEIPVQLKLHCTEELAGYVENPDQYERLREFWRAKETTRALLNYADIAVLMVGTPCSDGTLGRAYVGPPSNRINRPVCWVFPEDKLTLIHEIGHLFGCKHNREALNSELNQLIPPAFRHDYYPGANYGNLLKGSNMATIMAYTDQTHNIKIPYFSSKELTYYGLRLGDAHHDNRMQIMKTRFIMSQLGDKSGNCRHHDICCVSNCQQNCCNLQGPNIDTVAWKRRSNCLCLKCLVNTVYLALYKSRKSIQEGIKEEVEEASDAIEYFGA